MTTLHPEIEKHRPGKWPFYTPKFEKLRPGFFNFGAENGQFPILGFLEKKTQAWEQGIFGVGNGHFRGCDLPWENGTTTGHFPGLGFLISGLKMANSQSWDFLQNKTQAWELAIFGPEILKTQAWELVIFDPEIF